jgi:26S proteasome regulatory subunit N13
MSLREYMAFKAGRAFKRGDTNFVDPSPTKGAIWLTQEDDGLVHFKWRNRETDSLEEVIILPASIIVTC